MSERVEGDPSDPQMLVDSYFRGDASYWEQIYKGDGVLDLVHQLRLEIVLKFVDSLSIPHTQRVLDAGCGAGLATVALAMRGYRLYAVDSVPEMIERTRRRAAEEGVQSRVRCARADLHRLAFADQSFDLIVAAGVLPWLPAPEIALAEMCRVLKPGGRIIVTIDNRWGLCWFFDPLTNPLLKPFKETARTIIRRVRKLTPRARVQMVSIRECQKLLRSHGLEILEHRSLGFGPFSFCRREILPRATGLYLHRLLQGLADHDVRFFRSAGAQYVVMAEKSADLMQRQMTERDRRRDSLSTSPDQADTKTLASRESDTKTSRPAVSPALASGSKFRPGMHARR
jgi:ubiquinone/menaquinone biosynthesis C-methylase UbiE